jgi:hypothetical protein|tara:strand:- start:488 stop:706 length:219 start_codon:yes stop_codon:yes gene_type:complete
MQNLYIKIPLTEYQINEDFPNMLENEKKGFSVFKEHVLKVDIKGEVLKINLLMFPDQTNLKYIEIAPKFYEV